MKTSTRSRIRRIYEAYRPLHPALRTAVIWDSVNQAVSLAWPFLTGLLIDRIVNHRPMSELKWLIVATFGAMQVRGLIYFFLDKQYLKKVAFDNGEVASQTTLTGISRLSIGQITNQNSGYKHDIIKKGETALAQTIDLFLIQVISSVLRVLIAAIALLFISPLMGLVTIAAVALYVASSYVINKHLRSDVKRHAKMENKLGTSYWERIKNLRLVMVCGQEERLKREFAAKEKECNDFGRALWVRYVGLIHFLREPFQHLGQVGVMFVGASLASQGKVSVGAVVIALGWSNHAFSALSMVGSLQRQITKNNAQIGRYFDLVDMPPAVTIVENPVRPKEFRGEIEFRNVSFRYPEHQLEQEDDDDEDPDKEKGKQSIAVEDLSFRIPAGSVCAFVGPSGSGKTTAINLALRGYDPDRGQILVDGHDLKLLDLHHWRNSVGTVEQDPKLWDETVRYNLTYGLNGLSQDVTEADLERIARIARIDEFYPRLGAKRFETLIGENGVQLSGGQRQRIAIGRALMKNPSLVILDEATNALDPENEALVHQAMREAMKGRTSIVIAHRLSTIRHADQIIVFRKGGIAGIGNHAELMRSCMEYRNLVNREVSMFV
ncbi:MAG TPA: ABC transporter ATP-binding protein [Candidatus Paceibacterota bacterium]|nr:ABC transporter ATP-binding protein [Candidatus Paceibacterota bacterium]